MVFGKNDDCVNADYICCCPLPGQVAAAPNLHSESYGGQAGINHCFSPFSTLLFSTAPFVQSSDSLKSISSLHEMPYPPASTLTPRKKDSFLNAANSPLLRRNWQIKSATENPFAGNVCQIRHIIEYLPDASVQNLCNP